MTWFSFNLHDFSISFLSILFEGVPFMFIGTLIAGFIDAFVPAGAVEKRLPKSPALSIGLCGLLGAILPMCECGIVPVIRRMLRKGLPVSSAIAYLLAAPIVNVVVAISTFAAFRGEYPWLMTGLRLGLGFSVAVAAAHVVHRLPVAWVLNRTLLAGMRLPRRAAGAAADDADTGVSIGFANAGAEALVEARESASVPRKTISAVRCAAFDFLDIGFYLVIGAAITSVFNTAVSPSVILPLATNPVLAIGGMETLAMLLSLCSTSDAFIAANFFAFPFVAKLAFLVLGPMMDVKLLFMYQMVFTKKFTLALAAGLFLLVGIACLALNGLLPL